MWRFTRVPGMVLLMSMFTLAIPLAAAPQVAVIEVRGMVCLA